MELTYEQVQEKLCELSPAIANDDENALELVSTVRDELLKFNNN